MEETIKLSFQERFWLGLRKAVQNFPLSVLLALGLAVFGITNLYLEPAIRNSVLIMIGLGIGISMSAASSIAARQNRWPAWLYISLSAVVLLVIGSYIWTGWNHDFENGRWLLTGHLALISHLLVAIAAFGRRGQELSFWSYNRTLLLGFVWSGFFALVLFVGVIAAIGSVELLFGIDVENELYGSTYFLAAFIFHPLHFFGNLPTRFQPIPDYQTLGYPKIMRNLIQYVLLPLVVLYVTILYLYGLKNIFVEVTKGYTAWLVLVFSVVGVFALLLAYPMRQDPDERWVKVWDQLYFWLMIPLIGLLVYAVYIRVDNYGYTSNRVVLIYLIIWLGTLSIYMLSGRRWGIVFVPSSLLVLTMLSMIGPLSSSRLAVNWHIDRLLGLMEEHKLVPNKRFGDTLPDSVNAKLHSSVDYIVVQGYQDDIIPPFVQPLAKDSTPYLVQRDMLNQLKLKDIDNVRINTDDYHNIEADLSNGYSPMWPSKFIIELGDNANETEKKENKQPIQIRFEKKAEQIILTYQNRDQVLIDRKALLALGSKRDSSVFPPQRLQFALPKGLPAGEYLINSLNYRTTKDGKIEDLNIRITLVLYADSLR